MSGKSRLMPISYYNPKQAIRLSAYADTLILEPDGRKQRLRAIRFGGYPEMVRAMSDAIYAGATLETEFAGETAMLTCEPKKYECHLSHDGIYAEATILSLDDADEARQDIIAYYRRTGKLRRLHFGLLRNCSRNKKLEPQHNAAALAESKFFFVHYMRRKNHYGGILICSRL